MADATPPAAASLPSVVDWRKFLTDYPPGTRASVEGALEPGTTSIATPELQLYCDGSCRCLSYSSGGVETGGKLFPVFTPQKSYDFILCYSCLKCGTELKSFAVRIVGEKWTRDQRTLDISKMGEWPPFAYRTPAKVNSLAGPDRDLFFKGRKAECDGLGLGAFAYYRRIIEDQKNRLLDEIIQVARRSRSPEEAIFLLEKAKTETQFSRAVDMVRDAVPPSLLIDGHNPLTLLHRALSRNLHGASDEECLKAAHDVRVVLFAFAERLSQALKDQQELNDALSRLLNS